VKRIGMGTAVALLVLGLVSTLAPGANAAPATTSLAVSCLPGSGPDYPALPAPTGLEPLTLLAGHFTPGGTGTVDIGGAGAGVYCGQGFSTPFLLPNLTPTGGKLAYRGFAVPADFELGAMHHLDIYKLQVKVGNFDFCVDKKGDIAPTSVCKSVAAKPGKLARTGTDHLLDIVRIAVLVLGLGAGAHYLRRRRQARPA
jgi:hypothetical protein